MPAREDEEKEKREEKEEITVMKEKLMMYGKNWSYSISLTNFYLIYYDILSDWE